MGSAILFLGAILSCFLSWDGGVRGGSRIALTVDKDEPLVSNVEPEDLLSPVPSMRTAGPSLRNKRSVLLSPGDSEAAANGAGYPNLATQQSGRRESRASLGTAYGYVSPPSDFRWLGSMPLGPTDYPTGLPSTLSHSIPINKTSASY